MEELHICDVSRRFINPEHIWQTVRSKIQCETKKKKKSIGKRETTHTDAHYSHVGKTKYSQVIWWAVKCQHGVGIGAVIWTEPATRQSIKQKDLGVSLENTDNVYAGHSGCCQILTQWRLSVSFSILIHHRLVYRKRLGLKWLQMPKN